VQSISAPGQALVEALRLADRLSGMAPNALASAKELLNAAPNQALDAQLAAEREHFIVNLFHANGGEGIQAFVEKRPPHFG
jgi:enoyl-CoA hydratase/carnithine racemase